MWITCGTLLPEALFLRKTLSSKIASLKVSFVRTIMKGTTVFLLIKYYQCQFCLDDEYDDDDDKNDDTFENNSPENLINEELPP